MILVHRLGQDKINLIYLVLFFQFLCCLSCTLYKSISDISIVLEILYTLSNFDWLDAMIAGPWPNSSVIFHNKPNIGSAFMKMWHNNLSWLHMKVYYNYSRV